MGISLRLIYEIVLDALFPPASAQRELLSLTPEKALEILPRAPISPEQMARAIFAYKDERVSRLVWSIKYQRLIPAVRIGAHALASCLINEEINSANADAGDRSHSIHRSHLKTVVLVPVPVSRRRRRERGYNQCELLCQEMLPLVRDLMEKKHFTSIRVVVENNLLRRTAHRSRQTLKNRAGRLEGAKNIFGIDDDCARRLNREMAGTAGGGDTGQDAQLRVIVIDDVITTGSTMGEAIDTLDKAGFAETRGLALAH